MKHRVSPASQIARASAFTFRQCRSSYHTKIAHSIRPEDRRIWYHGTYPRDSSSWRSSASRSSSSTWVSNASQTEGVESTKKVTQTSQRPGNWNLVETAKHQLCVSLLIVPVATNLIRNGPMALQVEARLNVSEFAIARCSGPGIESKTTVSSNLS